MRPCDPKSLTSLLFQKCFSDAHSIATFLIVTIDRDLYLTEVADKNCMHFRITKLKSVPHVNVD